MRTFLSSLSYRWWQIGPVRWVIAGAIVAILGVGGFYLFGRSPSAAPVTKVAAVPTSKVTQRLSVAGCSAAEQQLRVLDARYPSVASRTPEVKEQARAAARDAGTMCTATQITFVNQVLLGDWGIRA